MKRQRYTYTELGMLLGIFVGGGLAIVLVATTGKTVYYALVGVGLALGLGLGAAFEGARRPHSGTESKGNTDGSGNV